MMVVAAAVVVSIGSNDQHGAPGDGDENGREVNDARLFQQAVAHFWSPQEIHFAESITARP